jgi:hypothetical protein
MFKLVRDLRTVWARGGGATDSAPARDSVTPCACLFSQVLKTPSAISGGRQELRSMKFGRKSFESYILKLWQHLLNFLVIDKS